MTLHPRYVQPVVMAAIMAVLMTGFVTWLNLGLRPDFLWLWLKAFLTAWPLASLAAYIAGPIAPKITHAIVQAVNAPR